MLKKARARVHGRPHKDLEAGAPNSGSKMTLFICLGSRGFSPRFSVFVYQLLSFWSVFPCSLAHGPDMATLVHAYYREDPLNLSA